MRIKEVFSKLAKENKKALIPFVTCGDPTIEETKKTVLALESLGADIIEIGIPYSDPLADGPIIQESYHKSLENGFKIGDIFKCIEAIRVESNIPLVVMVYFNIIYCYGQEEFLKKLKELKVDGLIVPDLPLEERGDFHSYCKEVGNIALIPLVAPTSKERIEEIVKDAEGFVYCVSVAGTTGERNSLGNDIEEYLTFVREKSKAPICVGFGISSAEIIENIRDYCDGVIIGSAIVKRIEDKEALGNFVKSCKKACS